jgi:hypothetical protein
LGPKFFTKRCIPHAASPNFLYGSKIWILRQKVKKTDINQEKVFSEEQQDTHFLTTKPMKKYWKS